MATRGFRPKQVLSQLHLKMTLTKSKSVLRFAQTTENYQLKVIMMLVKNTFSSKTGSALGGFKMFQVDMTLALRRLLLCRPDKGVEVLEEDSPI